MKHYRIQYAEQHRFAEMSEWRPLDQPITEPHILSFWFDATPTDEEMRKFWDDNKLGDS